MNIGNVLLAWGVINRAQLDEALRLQAAGSDRKLGEIIVGLGYATFEEVSLCLAKQELLRTGRAEMPDIECVEAFAQRESDEAQVQIDRLARAIGGQGPKKVR